MPGLVLTWAIIPTVPQQTMNTCTVYVRAKDGHFILGHVTAANSVFDAARNGLDFAAAVAVASHSGIPDSTLQHSLLETIFYYLHPRLLVDQLCR